MVTQNDAKSGHSNKNSIQNSRGVSPGNIVYIFFVGTLFLSLLDNHMFLLFLLTQNLRPPPPCRLLQSKMVNYRHMRIGWPQAFRRKCIPP